MCNLSTKIKTCFGCCGRFSYSTSPTFKNVTLVTDVFSNDQQKNEWMLVEWLLTTHNSQSLCHSLDSTLGDIIHYGAEVSSQGSPVRLPATSVVVYIHRQKKKTQIVNFVARILITRCHRNSVKGGGRNFKYRVAFELQIDIDISRSQSSDRPFTQKCSFPECTIQQYPRGRRRW